MKLTARLEASILVTREQYEAVNAAEKDGITEENSTIIQEAVKAMSKTATVSYKGGGTPMSRNLLINGMANVLRRNPEWLSMLLITLGVHQEMVNRTIENLERNN